MVNDNLETRSRWVVRALWLIVALLAIGILTIRSHGLASDMQKMSPGDKPSASLAFAVPTTQLASLHSFDTISWQGHSPVPAISKKSPGVIAGTILTVTGWAFLPANKQIFTAIGGEVDRRHETFSAVVGLMRPDVATALGSDQARPSGFVLNVDTSKLTVGHHTIAIRALAPDGKRAVALGSPIPFDILQAATAIQRTDSIDAVNGVVITDASHVGTITVLRSYRRLTIYGWAFITDGKRLASSAQILVDGNPIVSANYGIARADVANAYKDVRLSRCGFIASLSTESLTAGLHEIKVQLGTGDGTQIQSFSSIHINLQ